LISNRFSNAEAIFEDPLRAWGWMIIYVELTWGSSQADRRNDSFSKMHENRSLLTRAVVRPQREDKKQHPSDNHSRSKHRRSPPIWISGMAPEERADACAEKYCRHDEQSETMKAS
jgi:hypothetical protein